MNNQHCLFCVPDTHAWCCSCPGGTYSGYQRMGFVFPAANCTLHSMGKPRRALQSHPCPPSPPNPTPALTIWCQ
jgi:hypothetical protein